MNLRRTRMLAALLLFLLTVSAQQTELMRQPAPVMSAAGADWLTRPERIQEEDPDRMLSALDIKPGSVVADIGAGVGYRRRHPGRNDSKDEGKHRPTKVGQL